MYRYRCFQVLLDARQGRVTDVKTMIGTFWLEKVLSGTWPLGEPEKS